MGHSGPTTKDSIMKRREFLKAAGAAALGAVVSNWTEAMPVRKESDPSSHSLGTGPATRREEDCFLPDYLADDG